MGHMYSMSLDFITSHTSNAQITASHKVRSGSYQKLNGDGDRVGNIWRKFGAFVQNVHIHSKFAIKLLYYIAMTNCRYACKVDDN